MSIYIDVITLVLASIFIIKTAELLVEGAVDISLALRIPKALVAATIVSIVTTMPEFVVSVYSSLIGESGMAVGNAVGSCICNFGLIFAAGAIAGDIITDRKDIIAKSIILLSALFVVLFLGMNGVISRNGAAVLIILLGFYMYYSYASAQKHRKILEKQAVLQDGKRSASKGLLLVFIGGITTVLIARFGLVDPGINIAKYFGVPSILIGLTVIAVGTSLPELFTSVISSRKGHGEIALGNVMGANILNMLWVVGGAALANPLAIDRETLYFNIPAAIAFTGIVAFIGAMKTKYTRASGIVLLTLYAVYVVLLMAVMYR